VCYADDNDRILTAGFTSEYMHGKNITLVLMQKIKYIICHKQLVRERGIIIPFANLILEGLIFVMLQIKHYQNHMSSNITNRGVVLEASKLV
jgi:hypothetical protein